MEKHSFTLNGMMSRIHLDHRTDLQMVSWDTTVWKFTNLSATQILREINVGKLAVLEIAILTI